jgi:hypothetical protein
MSRIDLASASDGLKYMGQKWRIQFEVTADSESPPSGLTRLAAAHIAEIRQIRSRCLVRLPNMS